jgi:hypothetical protein
MFSKHPKGLIAAALANMGERFGFYIMMAILTLFISAKFGLSETTTGYIYSAFYASIYILALAGGVIADKTKNFKGTILVGLILMAIGYLIIAIPTPTPVPNMALYNLDITKRNMVEQEKKNRFIISEISKLNSNITGKDQYDNDVPLAAPHELTKIYSDIRIRELRLIITLAEEIIRTRQYKEQYLDILYKRVVLRGLQSLTRLRDIALTYNKEGFQNHKVIRVEPLTIGEGTSRATKRLDERINLVIRHNIDTADNEQAQAKILNYGGIYYRVIDSGELANISPDGLSGIDNEEYLISSFQRRLNKEAFDAGEFPSNYAIKVMTPAAAYEEI